METQSKSVQERYVFKPFVGSSHRWALEQIQNLGPATKALDIGPGSGVFADILRQNGAENIFALEIDPETREPLRDKYIKIVENLEELNETGFDFILLLDVLEHMCDPAEFLNKIIPLAKPGATFLISVPNVAHWSVRLPLFLEFLNIMIELS